MIKTKVAHDGDVITPVDGEMWEVHEGHVTVTGQTGGDCRFFDNSTGTVIGQSGGYCDFYDDSTGTITGQTGGVCRFYDNAAEK